MQVHVKCFAFIKDVLGRDDITVDLGDGLTAVDLWKRLQADEPRLLPYGTAVAVIVNEEFVAWDTELNDRDEVAFMPPVSGGSDEKLFEMIRDNLDAAAVKAKVSGDEGSGAIVVFYGVGRRFSRGKTVRYLEYDGYQPMAEKQLAAIGAEIKEKFGVERVAITHKLGRVDIGEPSVVIAVASPHRKEAFQACQYAIEAIKKVVPIWKKEVAEDGSSWVEGDASRPL